MSEFVQRTLCRRSRWRRVMRADGFQVAVDDARDGRRGSGAFVQFIDRHQQRDLDICFLRRGRFHLSKNRKRFFLSSFIILEILVRRRSHGRRRMQNDEGPMTAEKLNPPCLICDHGIIGYSSRMFAWLNEQSLKRPFLTTSSSFFIQDPSLITPHFTGRDCAAL